MTTSLQTQTLNHGQHTTTTYTRADLGVDTAVITHNRKGSWSARLLHGPEADETTTHTVDLESTADRLAIPHSHSF
jgi:hypothetical protein